uniref:Uncharacterized protein n=1 Tax=Anguilla anguilla TaxID=7936 RepID=A0A0E9QP00_ANGAN
MTSRNHKRIITFTRLATFICALYFYIKDRLKAYN